jgi:hypothetical protein
MTEPNRATTARMPLPQLRRIRWAVRGALALGVAASVTANVLHAEPNPISEVIAAWPPLALLLTIELISRIPVHRRWVAWVRLAATVTIAGIAAWVSYWHMAGVAGRYGETGATPYLLPFSVDGLVVVASVCLVELAGRIRAVEQPFAVRLPAVDVPAPVPSAVIADVRRGLWGEIVPSAPSDLAAVSASGETPPVERVAVAAAPAQVALAAPTVPAAATPASDSAAPATAAPAAPVPAAKSRQPAAAKRPARKTAKGDTPRDVARRRVGDGDTCATVAMSLGVDKRTVERWTGDIRQARQRAAGSAS